MQRRLTHTAPYYAYAHDTTMYSGDQCATGGSAITGVAFYPPSGARQLPHQLPGRAVLRRPSPQLHLVMDPGANGLPTVSTRTNFVVAATNPVDLQIGPNNDLFYVDYGGTGGQDTNAGTGKVHRIRYAVAHRHRHRQPDLGLRPAGRAASTAACRPRAWPATR